ncbi:MAG: Anion-transporting ATPase [Conexibacter sp.]|nr:Anion-transporting ATPase [Conexibacter sp.]
MTVAEVLAGTRVCVVGGSGGVGKTTTAAAVAAGMAAEGLKVAVVTIDPARRLADALGLDELDNAPRRVAPEPFAAAGLSLGDGELWAMQLDPKRTFDELIARLAPDERTRDEIFANRIYRELSGAVAGSQEFTAIAKVHELAQTGDFDLLVLDTPPSRNALDFLDAPDRLTQFFEGRALRVLLKPSGLGMRLLGRGTGVMLSILRRVTGVDLLTDLTSFFRLLGGLVDGFRERARQVDALLADPGTAFLVVTSPEREPIEETIYLDRTLAQARMSLAGAIVNRVHPDHLGPAEEATVAELLTTDAGLSAALARRVAESFREHQLLARRDDANVARLAAELRAVPLVLVPQLDADVHDAVGLVALHRYLFASAEERARLMAEAVA